MTLTPGRIAALRRLEPGREYPFDEVVGQVRVPLFQLHYLESVPDRQGQWMRLTELGAAVKEREGL